MYISTSHSTTEPITVTPYVATERHPAELIVMFSARASVHLTAAEAAELVAALTAALAELNVQAAA